MKHIIWSILLTSILAISCKKQTVPSGQLASLNITNALIEGTALKFGNYQNAIAPNASAKFTVPAGNRDINIYAESDVTKSYYRLKQNFSDGEIYSVFLCGQTTPESILVKESFPVHADSTAGVRFVNLSPGSEALNINIANSTNVEFANLQYKQLSQFKVYPATYRNATYIFQIRRASDNMVLNTYTLATPRFANVTLVIRGLTNGSPDLGVTRVNNDRP